MASGFAPQATRYLLEYFLMADGSGRPGHPTASVHADDSFMWLGICENITFDGGYIDIVNEPDPSVSGSSYGAGYGDSYSRQQIMCGGTTSEEFQHDALGVFSNTTEITIEHADTSYHPWGYDGNEANIYEFQYFFLAEENRTGSDPAYDKTYPSGNIIIAYGELAYAKPMYPGDKMIFPIGELKISITGCS